MRVECLAKRWHGLQAWWGENEATHWRRMAATSIHPNCTGSKRQKWYLYHLYRPKSRDTNFSNFVSPKKSWYNFLKFCITKKIFKSLKKICIRITRQKFFDTDLIIFNFFQLFWEWSNKKKYHCFNKWSWYDTNDTDTRHEYNRADPWLYPQLTKCMVTSLFKMQEWIEFLQK